MEPPASPSTLADALWRARRQGIVVDGRFPWAELSPDSARAVAAELVRRHAGTGDAQVGWKLGATDPAVQAAMGSVGPFTAPIFASTLLASGGTVSLRSFVAPILEMELAFVEGPGGRRPAACIEIADSRYGSWQLTLAQAIADFGLHGAIVVGAPPESWPDRVTAVLSHAGVEITRAEVVPSSYKDGVEVDGRYPDGAPAAPSFVATGSIGGLVPLTTGSWRADFGPVGAVELTVIP